LLQPYLALTTITAAAAPTGPLVQGIVSGDLLFVSGQLPVDPISGNIIGGEGNGDIVAQTKATLANIKAIVEASGSNLGKVINSKVRP
jgi:2-iminobutanoate/2-iminopropanoate deaminase